jgi:NAD(P)-dependent dehydrogenase (short-subunit alcohol dehydrogenase family)
MVATQELKDGRLDSRAKSVPEVGAMKIPFHTALITGSSRGIGRGIAVKLAKEGVKKIAVHYFTRQDEAEQTVAQLRDAGEEGCSCRATRPTQAERRR